jgi:hypothetical protein
MALRDESVGARGTELAERRVGQVDRGKRSGRPERWRDIVSKGVESGYAKSAVPVSQSLLDGHEEPARYETNPSPEGDHTSLCLGCCGRRA